MNQICDTISYVWVLKLQQEITPTLSDLTHYPHVRRTSDAVDHNTSYR